MVDSFCAGESRIIWDVLYIDLNLCVSQFVAPSRSIRTLSKSESPEHNCSRKAGRSRFTISSARANNANPVRVLTNVTVHFYFGKYKQRDCF